METRANHVWVGAVTLLILGALALISSEASIGGLSHGLGLVPRSQRSGLVKRRRVQAPATATDRIAQVTIGAYVAQVARPSLAALSSTHVHDLGRRRAASRLAEMLLSASYEAACRERADSGPTSDLNS